MNLIEILLRHPLLLLQTENEKNLLNMGSSFCKNIANFKTYHLDTFIKQKPLISEE